MDMIMFLNNNTGSNKSVTINKMMIRYNITIKEAKEIYTKWRKWYLMDYTPVNNLIHNYNFYVNNYRRWTTEEKVNVVKLKEIGLKTKYIANIYGVSTKAILNILNDMRVY